MTRLDEFIQTERERFATYDNNIFAVAMSQVARYYDFLSIILPRYEAESAQLKQSILDFQASLSSSGGPLTEWQQAHLRKQAALGVRVHLDIEAFYIFAKVLLDRVALFLERYFGSVRGMRLLSHSRLVQSLAPYAAARQLALSDDLLVRIASLEQRVGDYRDKHISHHHNLRTFRGTMFGPDGGMRIHSSPLYPKPEDGHAQSEDLAVLFTEIDEYLDTVLAFVRANASRTVLSIKGGANA